jgi:hypothetical protein
MTLRPLALALTAAALVVPALAAGAEDPLRDSLSPVRGERIRLSDENKLSRWAYTNLPSKVRKSPSDRSKSVGKLHFNTEDRLPERYLALEAYTDNRGAEWVRIRLLGRPNNRTGWVRREGLGEYHAVRTHLVINRKTLRATLFKNGKQIFKTPVGVGKSGTPTPAGFFYIRERLAGFGNAVYGPLAFGTSAYSKLSDWPGGGVVGIHGTNQPNLVPGRPSHGCVRMRNAAIKKLARLMPVGTPVRIL